MSTLYVAMGLIVLNQEKGSIAYRIITNGQSIKSDLVLKIAFLVSQFVCVFAWPVVLVVSIIVHTITTHHIIKHRNDECNIDEILNDYKDKEND